MSIFSSQIEKRRKLDASTLLREIKEGATRMGLHYGGTVPQTDNLAIRQVLEARRCVALGAAVAQHPPGPRHHDAPVEAH